jgi:hypothetical protein
MGRQFKDDKEFKEWVQKLGQNIVRNLNDNVMNNREPYDTPTESLGPMMKKASLKSWVQEKLAEGEAKIWRQVGGLANLGPTAGLHGEVGRLMRRAVPGPDRFEVWYQPDKEWVEDTSISHREYLTAPLARPELLRSLEIPESFWGRDGNTVNQPQVTP